MHIVIVDDELIVGNVLQESFKRILSADGGEHEVVLINSFADAREFIALCDSANTAFVLDHHLGSNEGDGDTLAHHCAYRGIPYGRCTGYSRDVKNVGVGILPKPFQLSEAESFLQKLLCVPA